MNYSKICESTESTVASKTKHGHKTPQSLTSGINKSFLTPCRRMGLQRKSPLSSRTVKISPQSVPKIICNSPVVQAKRSHSSDGKNDEHGNNENLTHNSIESKNYITPKRKFISIGKNEKLSIKIVNQTTTNHENAKCDTHKKELEIPILSMNCEPLGNIIETLDVIGDTRTNETELIVGNITEQALVELRQRIKEKEEKVNELKLAQLYRKKHDLNRLTQLTEKWRSSCQEALLELLDTSCTQGYQLDMTQLLTQLGIPHDLVGYNQDLDEFH